MNIKRLKKHINNPRLILGSIIWHNARLFKDDKLYLSLLWWCNMGYKLDWEHPKTFCEKIQWLKLHSRNPLHVKLVDKLEVKQYVADIIGKDYIIPTLGVWEHAENIDFDLLPERFVLKTTHGSGGGGVFICRNNYALNKTAVINSLHKMLKQNTYVRLREWPYRNVPKRIIAEKFLVNNPDVELTDYKFYCFNGYAKYCQLIANRSTDETIDFYDRDWKHQEFIGLLPTAHHASTAHHAPENYKEMFAIADKLSTAIGIPFVRIDLYNVNRKIYFGEVTFFPGSGLGRFNPSYWDKWLGDMIKI